MVHRPGIVVLASAALLSLGILAFSRGARERVMDRLVPDMGLAFGSATNDLPRMQRAVEWGANVDGPRSYANRTALMGTAIHGRAAAAAFLLAHGANPNRRDDKGLTALDLAERCKQPAVAALLKAAMRQPDRPPGSPALPDGASD